MTESRSRFVGPAGAADVPNSRPQSGPGLTILYTALLALSLALGRRFGVGHRFPSSIWLACARARRKLNRAGWPCQCDFLYGPLGNRSTSLITGLGTGSVTNPLLLLREPPSRLLRARLRTSPHQGPFDNHERGALTYPVLRSSGLGSCHGWASPASLPERPVPQHPGRSFPPQFTRERRQPVARSAARTFSSEASSLTICLRRRSFPPSRVFCSLLYLSVAFGTPLHPSQ